MSDKKETRTILVAVDGSKDSDNAFNYAIKNSSQQDKLIVVNARPDTDAANYMMPDEQATKKELEISQKILRKYGEMCKSSQRHCALISEKYSGGSGSLGETVCSLAQQQKADEIIVGNRGITPLKRMMLGSVSSYIANNCECNVIIVKK